jgi:8-oxo-dGTP diphosphatase
LPGEEPAHTLKRELQEEIGITPSEFDGLGVLLEPNPEIHGQREYHVFVVTKWIGEGPTILGDEHSELGWFGLEEASKLDLAHPGYLELFQIVLG